MSFGRVQRVLVDILDDEPGGLTVAELVPLAQQALRDLASDGWPWAYASRSGVTNSLGRLHERGEVSVDGRGKWRRSASRSDGEAVR